MNEGFICWLLVHAYMGIGATTDSTSTWKGLSDTLPWPHCFPGSGEVRAGCNCRTGAWLTAFVFSYRWCRRVYVEKGWDNKGRKWKLNLDTWGENYKLKQEITQPKISTFYDLRRKKPHLYSAKMWYLAQEVRRRLLFLSWKKSKSTIWDMVDKMWKLMYVLYSLWGSCEVKHLQAAAQKNTDILLFKHDVKFLAKIDENSPDSRQDICFHCGHTELQQV